MLLVISDIPTSKLTLGSNLDGSNIKEGDDVYFECAVQASPPPYKITWRHNVGFYLLMNYLNILGHSFFYYNIVLSEVIAILCFL